MKSLARGAAILLASSQIASARLLDIFSNTENDRVEKRWTNTSAVVAPISFAASQYWDGDDGPWSSFAIQVGDHAQTVRVFPSTAGYTTWVVEPQGCPSGYPSSCPSDRGDTFNSNNSLTWVAVSTYDFGIETNLNMDESGNYGFDTVTLGWDGSGGPTFDHAVVASIATADYWLGIFGLKPQPTNFTTYDNPQQSYMQYLNSSNKIPSTSYGYTAGNQYRSTGVFGSLTLGGYDAARFDNDNNITVGMYQDISRDLLVGLQSVSIDTSTPTTWSDGITAYIDSTVSQLWLPTDLCAKFEAAFGLVWDTTYATEYTEGWYIMNDTVHKQNVANNYNVTLTLGATASGGSTIDIVFPYSAFALTLEYAILGGNDSSYYFPLFQTNSSTQYTLGRTFFQEAYVIANYEDLTFTVAPCVWTNLTENIKSILLDGETIADASKSSSSISAGAIAGIVVGLVALIALLLLALLFLRRRKQKREANQKAQAEKSLELSAAESEPLAGRDGSPIHELAEPKFAPAEMDNPHVRDPNKLGYNEVEGDSTEYFGKAPHYGANEMQGDSQIYYEMPGSEVHEMPTGQEQEKPEKS